MIYLLDSSPCSGYMRGKNQLLLQRFSVHPSVDIAVSTVVIGELFYGAERSQNPIKNRSKVKDFIRPYQKLSFSSKAARFFATIRFDLSKRGLPIGPYDLQIAAIALANNLTLVTHNTNEFSRVPGLAIEDWELPRNRLHK